MINFICVLHSRDPPAKSYAHSVSNAWEQQRGNITMQAHGAEQQGGGEMEDKQK